MRERQAHGTGTLGVAQQSGGEVAMARVDIRRFKGRAERGAEGVPYSQDAKGAAVVQGWQGLKGFPGVEERGGGLGDERRSGFCQGGVMVGEGGGAGVKPMKEGVGEGRSWQGSEVRELGPG
ncbi:hypothetical protein HK101_002307 [Irineochytrium annulatum]|nr:hypothetical protein HK101_002307 [Irineochytrium annulatum]